MPESNNERDAAYFREVFLTPLNRELSQRMSDFDRRLTELRDEYKESTKGFDAILRLQSDPVNGMITRGEYAVRLDRMDTKVDQNRKDAEKALTAQSKWAIGGIIAVLFQVIQFMAQLLTTGHMHI